MAQTHRCQAQGPFGSAALQAKVVNLCIYSEAVIAHTGGRSD